jgi:hypothetical protein
MHVLHYTSAEIEILICPKVIARKNTRRILDSTRVFLDWQFNPKRP